MVDKNVLVCCSVMERSLAPFRTIETPLRVRRAYTTAQAILIRVNAVKHLLACVERIEIAKTHGAIEAIAVPSAVRSPYCRAIVQNKGISTFIKFCKVLPGVVVIVTVLVHLEQTGDIFVGAFIRIRTKVEQIIQGSIIIVVI